jgi:chromosome segregation ATPase
VPLEARLAGIEGRDPQAELLPLEARLQALGDRLGTLEAAEDRLAALGERLAGLHAQKDAALEAVLGRLQALEAGLAARDPEGALEMLAARLEAAREAAEAGLRERLAALEAPEADAFAGIAAQLGELAARKDAAVEAMLGRLAPLEARLQAIEAGGGSDRRAEDDARAEAQAIATQLIAMRAAAVQTELFADRLALLEASLPRLSVAQSLMMQALERQAAGAPAGPTAATPGPGSEDPLAAFRDLPRIVSLHQR